MGKTIYKVTNDPNKILLKGEFDDNWMFLKAYSWLEKEREWKENTDQYCGYFLGFDSATIVPEDKLEDYM